MSCCLLVALAAAPALAQGRDPFRPPAGAGPSQGDDGSPPSVDDGGRTPTDASRLPRTGQDLMLLVAIAAVFLCSGGALRLTGRLLTA